MVIIQIEGGNQNNHDNQENFVRGGGKRIIKIIRMIGKIMIIRKILHERGWKQDNQDNLT